MSDTDHDVQIQSYKHNGKIHRVWETNAVLERTNDRLIAGNDRTRVCEADGDIWRTTEPAVCCFYSVYWFNVVASARADGVHYYCNLSSPFVYKNRTVIYTDYDLDIVVYPDGSYDLLDEDEFAARQYEMGYPETLVTTLWEQVDYLKRLIEQKREPFAPGFIEEWYRQFLSERPI